MATNNTGVTGRTKRTPEQSAFDSGMMDRSSGYMLDGNCPYPDPKLAEAWKMGWRKRDKELTLGKQWTAPTRIRKCECYEPEFQPATQHPHIEVCIKCNRPQRDQYERKYYQ
jgi:ribosome modulation factor